MTQLVLLQESTPNAGEAMAIKDGISVCSTDSNRDSERSESTNNNNVQQQPDFDDDISSITLATDNKYSMLCKYMMRIVCRLMHSYIVCARARAYNHEDDKLFEVIDIRD